MDMDRNAFLFDLDGVIFDTEGQYSVLWDELGDRYFSDREFGGRIKGQTLPRIFDTYFPGDTALQNEIRARLDVFEREMDYSYIPGVEEFLEDLKRRGCPAAIVTSSDRSKMQNVYMAHPEIKSLVTHIFTGEDFTRSKPFPDCYIMGMNVFGTLPGNTFIFEDSFNGLQAAKDSGGNVIALATTNAREDVAPYAGLVIDNFIGLTVEKLQDNFYICRA